MRQIHIRKIRMHIFVITAATNAMPFISSFPFPFELPTSSVGISIARRFSLVNRKFEKISVFLFFKKSRLRASFHTLFGKRRPFWRRSARPLWKAFASFGRRFESLLAIAKGFQRFAQGIQLGKPFLDFDGIIRFGARADHHTPFHRRR